MSCFLTDDQYCLKYKRQINIQAAVEKPYLYILACCPSNDQHILYSEERISDILKIIESLQFYNDLEMYDVLRSFKWGFSAGQFKAAHQKGGNFLCIACPIYANNLKKIASSYSKKNYLFKTVEKVESTTDAVSRS